jgi:predicted RNA methylase
MCDRNKGMKCVIGLLFTIILVSCGKSQNDDKICEQWDVLNKALTALYNEQFSTYLSFLDSAQVESQDKMLILNVLKQKYTKTDSTQIPKLVFSKVNLINTDSADIYYTEIYSNDTVYEMQKMRRSNGKWKLLIF